jgi:hypothetical protein
LVPKGKKSTEELIFIKSSGPGRMRVFAKGRAPLRSYSKWREEKQRTHIDAVK